MTKGINFNNSELKIYFLGDKDEVLNVKKNGISNKISIQYHLLSKINPNIELLDISTTATNKYLEKLSILMKYTDIFVYLNKKTHDKNTIIILSESKFKLFHTVITKFICKTNNIILISGFHVLSQDHLFFVDKKYQQQKLSPSQQINLRFLCLKDKICLYLVDILQSYSNEYAERIYQVTKLRKPCVIIPIGTNLNVQLEKRKNYDFYKSHSDETINIVFWGNATALHGLNLLADVATELEKIKISVNFHIFSPRNMYIDNLIEEVKLRKIESYFIFDFTTKVSEDFNVVKKYDLAISHFISKDINTSCNQAMNAITSNKLYEILSIGMPLITAKTNALSSILTDDECLFVDPQSSQSIVDVIKKVHEKKINLKEVANNGYQKYKNKFTYEVLSSEIKTDLLKLINTDKIN